MKKSIGFTLAELLIALGILGVIATFAIPKVLQSQHDSKNKAILQESITTLNQVLYQGLLTQQISTSSSNDDVRAYFLSHMNGVKICPDKSSDGCCTGGMLMCTSESAVTLHNGAVLYSISLESNGTISSMIDINGPDGPNVEGQDVLMVMPVIGPNAVDGFKPGTVGPWNAWPSDGTSSQTLFQETFTR